MVSLLDKQWSDFAYIVHNDSHFVRFFFRECLAIKLRKTIWNTISRALSMKEIDQFICLVTHKRTENYTWSWNCMKINGAS